MLYSLVGIIAIGVHILVNIDVFARLRGKMHFQGEKHYAFFLLSVIAYHLTDVLWGFLADAKLVVPLFIDTSFYFVAMAASILFWGLFVYQYNGKSKNGLMVVFGGLGVFFIQLVTIFLNIFVPILFTIDKDTCEYSAQWGRYAMLTIQIIMYLIISILALVFCFKIKGTRRRHHFAITIFGLFMTTFIILQVFFPLLPMYSIGFLAGVTALHTFVIRDEFFNQQGKLEFAEKQINIDSLTGVLSKHAYIDMEALVDKRINTGEMEEFAIAIFDLNDLKKVNDNLGHEAGDAYIIDSTKLIAKCFVDSPVYRVGGDEFAVFLLKYNYQNRYKYLEEFNQIIDENVKAGTTVVISAGVSEYQKGIDTNILQVFRRADMAMYDRKHRLKEYRQQ